MRRFDREEQKEILDFLKEHREQIVKGDLYDLAKMLDVRKQTMYNYWKKVKGDIRLLNGRRRKHKNG